MIHNSRDFISCSMNKCRNRTLEPTAFQFHSLWLNYSACGTISSRYFMKLWFESREIGSNLVQFVTNANWQRGWYVVRSRTKTRKRSNRDNCWQISFPSLTQKAFALNRELGKPTETPPFAYQLSGDSLYVDSQFELLIFSRFVRHSSGFMWLCKSPCMCCSSMTSFD